MEKENAHTEQTSRRIRRWQVIRAFLLAPGWLFFIATLLVHAGFVAFPVVHTSFYIHLIFPFCRSIADGLGITLVVVLLVLAVSFTLYLCTQQRRLFWSAWWFWVASFFWLFGFHYAAAPKFLYVPLSHDIDWKPLQLQLVDSLNAFCEEREHLYKRLLTADDLRPSACTVLQHFGKPCCGAPEVYSVAENSAWLSRCGIAGVYVPWLFAGIYDGSFGSPAGTFILAHELGHAYGIAPEQDADMFAYMVLTTCGLREAKYSAYLAVYRSVRRELLIQNRQVADSCEMLLSPVLRADLEALRGHAKRYPEFFPGIQDRVNHVYLYGMGQAGGVRSYDMLALHVHSLWRTQDLYR